MQNLYQQCMYHAHLTSRELIHMSPSEKMLNADYVAYPRNKFCIVKKHDTTSDYTGWKFHVGVDDKQIAEAFDIIGNIALKHKCQAFKVLMQDIKLSTLERGKNIVLYDTGTENWGAIIPEMENALRTANILPHDLMNHPNEESSICQDKKLKNSLYFRYCCDLGLNSRNQIVHKGGDEKFSNNELGMPDPFEGIKIQSGLTQRLQDNSESLWKDYKNWQEALDANHMPITRIPINQIGEKSAQELVNFLKKNRIPYRLHESEKLGETIRVCGKDNIQRLRTNIENPWKDYKNWQEAQGSSQTPFTRIPISQIGEKSAQELVNFLKKNRIPYRLHESEKLGETIRVWGPENILRLKKALQGNTPPPRGMVNQQRY